MPLLAVGVGNKAFFTFRLLLLQYTCKTFRISICNRMPDCGIENLLCILKKMHRSREILIVFLPRLCRDFFCSALATKSSSYLKANKISVQRIRPMLSTVIILRCRIFDLVFFFSFHRCCRLFARESIFFRNGFCHPFWLTISLQIICMKSFNFYFLLLWFRVWDIRDIKRSVYASVLPVNSQNFICVCI